MTRLSFSLQPTSALPLYYQLAQALRSYIATGLWKPGDMIISERELMQAAGVSRATVRRALSDLIRQGVLEQAHGRGTFVAHPKVEQELRTVYSFADQIRRLGLVLEDQQLQRRVLPATPDVARMLSVSPGEPLLHIQRLRLVNGSPLILDSSYLPYALCPELLDDQLETSLYWSLARRCNLPIGHSTDTVEALVADRVQAHLLKIRTGDPLIFVERVAFTSSDVPIHVGRNYIRGDRCRFRVNLWSEPAPVKLEFMDVPDAMPTLSAQS